MKLDSFIKSSIDCKDQMFCCCQSRETYENNAKTRFETL